MAAANWPVGLPRSPLAGSFKEEPAPSVIAFDPEVGPAKTRRRSTAVSVAAEMAFALTPAQKEELDFFFETTLAGGTLRFTLAHPDTGGPRTWKFRGAPAATFAKAHWRATLALTRLD